MTSLLLAGVLTTLVLCCHRRTNLSDSEVENFLTLSRRVLLGVCLVYIVTTPFVASVVILDTGYQPSFYSSVGLYEPLVATLEDYTLLDNPTFLYLYQAVTALFLLLAMARSWVGVTLPVAVGLFGGYVAMLVRASLKGHLILQPIFLLLVLVAIIAIAHYRNRRGQTSNTDASAALLVFLAAVAIPYLFAAANKLATQGMAWVSEANVRGHLLIGSYLNTGSWQWSASLALNQVPDWIFIASGIAVIAVQLSTLLYIRSHTARQLVPFGIIALHLGIYIFMGFLFYDLIAIQGLVLYLAYRERTAPEIPATRIRVPVPYIVLLFILFYIPSHLLTTAEKMHVPFTSWAVYTTEPEYKQTGVFLLTDATITYSDTRTEQLAIGTLQNRVGLYVYPRAKCYWLGSVQSNLWDCQRFFTAIVPSLEQASGTSIEQITLNFYSVRRDELSADYTPTNPYATQLMYLNR